MENDTLAQRWIREFLDFPHDWCCLIWPFSRSQTGYAMIGGDAVRVHRVMCEHRNGPPPTPGHHAAHSCDRGHEGCVNQWHLDWKTPSENQLDRFKDGMTMPGRKITPDDARKIRDVKGLKRILDTASRFGISESNVRLIQAGKTWRMDKRGIHIFTRDELLRIKTAPQARGVTKTFASEFGVHTTTIQRIRSGTYYKWFEAPADGGGK
jgi:hypothetical protein